MYLHYAPPTCYLNLMFVRGIQSEKNSLKGKEKWHKIVWQVDELRSCDKAQYKVNMDYFELSSMLSSSSGAQE